MRQELGKIEKVRFGKMGRDDCMFGIQFTFRGPFGGVMDHIGPWDPEEIPVGQYTKWTEEERTQLLAEMCRKVSKLLTQAKVKDVHDLVGTPVELKFDGMQLKSWRILEEVL